MLKPQPLSELGKIAPPGALSGSGLPNPIQALQTGWNVPLAHLARVLGVSLDHLRRQRDGELPIPQILMLALEAVDYRFERFGHGYVHPNRTRPTYYKRRATRQR
jgi:hypothetical protein